MKFKNQSIKNTLKYSTVEGSLWAFMYGMGENYLSALAVFLGFSAFQISFLNSFPQLIGSILQLFSRNLLRMFKTAKHFVVFLSLAQALLWLILIYIISYNPEFQYLVLWFVIYFLCNSFIGPAWTSWMGYLVPKRIRGSYYGSRNRTINMFILIAILIGGFVLKKYSNDLIIGFVVLFIVASLGRFLSTFYLSKKLIPEISDSDNDNNFRFFFDNDITFRYLIFKILLNFSVMFLGSLFTIYILRTLGLSHFILSICTVTWWLANVFSAKYWGRFSKINGNVRILKIAIIVLTILPVFWILTYYLSGYSQILLITLINLVAGFIFSGFSLASFNLVYELVEKKDVVKYTSLLHLGEGGSIFLGSIIAGGIVDSVFIKNLFLNINFTPIQLSMLFSMVLRFVCLIYFLKFEKEIIKIS